jgi:hypothetical protein
METRVRAGIVVGVLLIAACSENSTNPLSPSMSKRPVSPPPIVTPLCQLGCGDVDPSPTAPGIFLGNSINLDFCMDGPGNDVDADGLVDYCETLISYNFSPLRQYSRFHDDIRGEPYWVAQWDGDLVIVGYLLSYYRDLGGVQYGCASPFLPEDPDTGCHNGDSESIWLWINYNYATRHWLLYKAAYSVHGNWNMSTDDGRGYAPNVEYPARLGGYPLAWIAEQKHANYFHKRDCNAGGFWGSDDCNEDDTQARVPWSDYWNIGSQAHPFINQVTSRDPSYEYYGQGRTECFWTDKAFRGWVPDNIGGGQSTSYLTTLRAWRVATTGVTGCN